MNKQEKLKAKVMAENIRFMANKIENGFPITEEQKNILVKLVRDIVLLHPTEYCKPKQEESVERERD